MIQSREKKNLHARTRAEKRVLPSLFRWWTTVEMIKNGIAGVVCVCMFDLFIFCCGFVLNIQENKTICWYQPDTQNMTNVFDVQQCIIEMSTCNRCVAHRTFSEYEITIIPSLTTCSPNRLWKLKFNAHQMFLAQCKNCAVFFLILREWGKRQEDCTGFESISLKKHAISNALCMFSSSLFKTTKWDFFPFSSLFPLPGTIAQRSKKDATSLVFFSGTSIFCLIYKLDQPERTEFPFLCNLHFSFDFWMFWSVIERTDEFIKNPKNKARENHMSLIAKAEKKMYN